MDTVTEECQECGTDVELLEEVAEEADNGVWCNECTPHGGSDK